MIILEKEIAEEAAELTETELEGVKEKLAILEVRESYSSFLKQY